MLKLHCLLRLVSNRFARASIAAISKTNTYAPRPYLNLSSRRLMSSSQNPTQLSNEIDADQDQKMLKLIQKNIEIEKYIRDRFRLMKQNDSNKLRHMLIKYCDKSKRKTLDDKAYFKNIKTFAYLAETPNDIDLLIRSVKHYLTTTKVKPEFNIGPVIMRTLFLLDMQDKALELLYDAELEALDVFKNPASIAILMKKFFNNGNHARVLDVFERQVKFYSIDNIEIKQRDYLSENTLSLDNPQAIPIDHFDTVTKSLVHINNKEALHKAKHLVQTAKMKSSSIGNFSTLRLFLLAIYQNDLEFAAQMIEMIDSSNTDKKKLRSLQLNLNAMISLKSKQIDKAFQLVDEVLSIKKDPVLALDGCLFFDVIKLFQSILIAEEAGINENEASKTRLREIIKRVKNESRLVKVDLRDFAMNTHYFKLYKN